MHITLNRNTLLEHLELATKVSTKHATLPVLQCVVLDVRENKLFIKATDLEIGFESTLEAKIEEEGIIAVPATTLTQTINFLNENEITLKN